MKRLLTVAALLGILCLPTWADTRSVERSLGTLAEKLAASYLGGEARAFRVNVSIGEIEDRSPAAEALHMGEAVRELLLGIFSRSNLFAVIERDKLDLLLQEQELQLSDITDEESAVEIGNILNAEAILYGSISELGGAFLVSATFVNVETGRSLTEQASLEKAALSAAAEQRLDMMYVQPMGIGLSLSGVGINVSGNNSTLVPFPEVNDTIFRRNFSLEASYRVTRFLKVGVGLDYVYGQFVHYDNLAWDWGGADPAPYPAASSAPFNVVGVGLGIPVRATLSWSPIRWLNLFAYGAMEYFILDCEGHFEPSNGVGFGVNDYGPSLHAEFLSFGGGLGVEAFVSPRLAFSLSGGYEYGKTELDTAPLGHLPALQAAPLEIDLSGLRLEARVSAYF